VSLIRKIGMISCDAKRTPTTRAILTLRGAAGRRDEGFLRKLENSPQERGILGWGTRPPRRVPFSSFVVPLAGGVGDSRESSKTSPDAIVESRVGRVPTSSPGDTIAITHRDETQRVASGDPPLRYPQCQCYATGHDVLHPIVQVLPDWPCILHMVPCCGTLACMRVTFCKTAWVISEAR